MYMKAKHCDEVKKFSDILNVGPAMTRDFTLLGITKPTQLAKKDPYKLFKQLEKITGVRHDPCVLDTYMAVVDFMNGARAKPWFAYTNERKKRDQT